MLKVEKINVFYGQVQVLYDVSFEINAGEIVTILGSNGAGKTTAIKAVCGLLPVKKGAVYYNEKRIDIIPPYKLAGLGLALVPEGRRLFPAMSVRENLLLGAYSKQASKVRADTLAWVFELLPRLKERMKQLAGTLSGGEQQMCAIARALMAKPKFLILDEPSLGLAPIIVDKIFDTIQLIRKESDITILLVEQNAYLALQIADRGYVFENGKVKMTDKADALLGSIDIQKTYLGVDVGEKIS